MILHLGLNENVVMALCSRGGDPRFVYRASP